MDMTSPPESAPAVPDEELTRTARDVVRSAMRDAVATVSITARDGEVTLAGTLASRAELRQIEDLIKHVRGVRHIDNLITVSDGTTRQSRAIAAELQNAIASAFPDARVSVTVFSDVAVLTGTAPDPAAARGVERCVEGHAKVSRVVNKIRVADGSSGSTR